MTDITTQYVTLLKKILAEGEFKQTRNGPVWSIFGQELSFDLSTGKIPALHIRRVAVKQAFIELIWILNGSKSSLELEDQGVKVWKGNTTVEFLRANSTLKDPQPGEMGETYGFLMNHYGAKYQGLDHDYTGEGFNQLEHLVKTLKTDPNNRRLILNLFKPDAQKNCSLPPCVMLYNFNVTRGKLNCWIHIRSSDTAVGLPWNFLTGAYLVLLLANLCDLTPGIVKFALVDAHIYQNNLKGVEQLLSREVSDQLPSFRLKKKIASLEELKALSFDDVEIDGYQPLGRIPMEMQA